MSLRGHGEVRGGVQGPVRGHLRLWQAVHQGARAQLLHCQGDTTFYNDLHNFTSNVETHKNVGDNFNFVYK